ncbi:hypothetical protein ACQJBY_051711 [Aegilops geniculata]
MPSAPIHPSSPSLVEITVGAALPVELAPRHRREETPPAKASMGPPRLSATSSLPTSARHIRLSCPSPSSRAIDSRSPFVGGVKRRPGGTHRRRVPVARPGPPPQRPLLHDPHEKFLRPMRGTQGTLIVTSTLQIVMGFSDHWRIVIRLLSPLSAVPLVGFGLYELGFPSVRLFILCICKSALLNYVCL